MRIRARQLDENGKIVRLLEAVCAKGDFCSITYSKEDGGQVIVDIDTRELKLERLELGGA